MIVVQLGRPIVLLGVEPKTSARETGTVSDQLRLVNSEGLKVLTWLEGRFRPARTGDVRDLEPRQVSQRLLGNKRERREDRRGHDVCLRSAKSSCEMSSVQSRKAMNSGFLSL